MKIQLIKHIKKLNAVWLFHFVRMWIAKMPKKDEGITKQKKKTKRRSISNGELVAGQYPKLKDLMADLDNVFSDLALMKPHKHQTQKIIQRYGPYLSGPAASGEAIIQVNQLEGFKAYGLPTFLICWHRPNTDRMPDALNQYHCAVKTESFPAWRKRPDCVYYEMTSVILCDGKPFEIVSYYEVNKENGTVTPLPSPTKKVRTVMHKSGKQSGRKFSQIAYQNFQYPDFRDDSVKEREGNSQKAIKDWLLMRFCGAYNMTMFREYTINIIAIKGKHRVTFSVPQNQWKDFFSDRIKIKTRSGYTKPIFHAVVAHKRKTKSKETYVKTHYRGLRHFLWNGYRIAIVMPGKHGVAQASIDIETIKTESRVKGTISVSGSRSSESINALFDRQSA